MSRLSSGWRAPIGHQSTRLASITLVLLICSLAACGSSAAHHAKPTPTPIPTSTPAPKGWSTVPSPGVGQEGDLRAVTTISATASWAVGQYEGLDSLQRTLTERWNGTEWTVQSSPNPGQEDNMLQAVSGSSASDVWAVGYQLSTGGTDQPLIEHWSGSAWSVVASAAQAHTTATLSGVAAISPMDAWAVGAINIPPTGNTPPGETPLIEHWNGSVWSVVNGAAIPLPSGAVPQNSLAAVAALSANNVWVVGEDFTDNSKPMQALIEHWNGQHWTLVQGANPNDNGNELSGIAAVSPNNIWAVGSGAPYIANSCGFVNSVLIEHWNGSAWSSVPVALPASSPGYGFSLASIAAASANDIWAVGGQNAYSASAGAYIAPVVEHWNGAQWTLASTPGVNTSHGLAGVAAGHGGPMFTVGQYEAANGPSATLAEQSNGTTLSLVASASPGTLFNSLQAVTSISANDAWAVGSSAAGNLAEHWDGNTWTVSTVPNASAAGDSLSGVAGTSSSDVWAVGSANNTASIAHWNGSQWTVTAPDPHSLTLSGVLALSASNAWAVGSATGPLVEHWNGTKWSAVATPTSSQGMDLTADSLLAVAAVSPSDIWAVGGTPPHNCGGEMPALIEHWNGSSWSVIPNLPQGVLYGVTAISANDVWAVGTSGNDPFILHWDGKHWSTVQAPAPFAHSYPQLQSVAAHGADDVWAVGSASAYPAGTQVVVLHWDGHAWRNVPVSAPGVVNNALYGVTAVADGEVWAVGQYDDNGDSGGPFAAHQALIEHYNP